MQLKGHNSFYKRQHKNALLITVASFVCVSFSCFSFGRSAAFAAEDLKLKPGISFNQDIDNGFPILGTKMDDLTIDTGTPAFLFFGASGDLNTNRQAKRLVDFYQHSDKGTLKFIVVDVDHANSDNARKLIKSYYRGYIPFEVVIDKAGKVSWSQIGEVDEAAIKHKVAAVL